MADAEPRPLMQRLETISYETALCIVPPMWYCHEVDKLRELYDKGYGKWPAHINLIYPFVAVEHLPHARDLLEARVGRLANLRVALGSADFFAHRQSNTVFACEDAASANDSLMRLRTAALEAMGQPASPANFHLTIGQSPDGSLSARDYLLSKAKLLPPVGFPIEHLVILTRERSPEDKPASHMKLWGTVNLANDTSAPFPADFWTQERPPTMSKEEEQTVVYEEDDADPDQFVCAAGRPETTYAYDMEACVWEPFPRATSQPKPELMPKILRIADYNVLMDSAFPPANDRDSNLLRTILSDSALADILVLQEVSDGFLTELLADPDIQEYYTFTSYGPSNQPDIGPLPSLRNIVILSRYPFNWTWLPFQRRHKGAAIACFSDIGKWKDGIFSPLVLAGIHLTSGLTDGAVAAKKIQVGILLSHLKHNHSGCPWILAGDFNITTSTSTINLALKDKSISLPTIEVLSTIESSMLDNGFLDSWSVARIEGTDMTSTAQSFEMSELFEGEDGATFNAMENALAAKSSGTSRNRPQRYDRILVKGEGIMRTSMFNMFGLPIDALESEDAESELVAVPSDHFGIRTTLKVDDSSGAVAKADNEPTPIPSLQIRTLHDGLASNVSLSSALSLHTMYPTDVEAVQRKQAFDLVKQVVSGSNNTEDAASTHVLLEITPVGSYALGVWTAASDIDCLCIGNISSKTFFKLARQRIRKAATRGLRILRKVEANSGTMLELLVNGVYMDLQYCPATRVVEKWSSIRQVSPTDPSFDLPILSLRKLKPYRDLDYVQRTLPDIAAFRLAFRCIKLWAVQNGLYSSKFGYLGGIHITLMLSTISKRMAHQAGHFTAGDLVATFFHYYANFDWKNEMVYDPFFHKTHPRYHRTAREPMVILGFHAPNSNVAHTSTIPGLEVLVNELKLADRRLSEASMTWEEFLDPSATDPDSVGHSRSFLNSFDSYVRIDVQYWGRTLPKGKSLIGWLESRCLILVVEIQRILPHLQVRVWPARFTTSDADSEQDHQGCYVVGLSRHGDGDIAVSKEDRAAARNQLLNVLKRFESQLRGDSKYYDPASSWIGVDLVKRSEIATLRVDGRGWGDQLAEEDGDESEDDDELDPAEGEETLHIVRPLPIRSAASGSGASGERKKLRPAADVLNRLRWDSHLSLVDYIVGYEDRFLGAKETTLDKWKTEKTDEEFIPQHRILYFRRKSDGLVVWDRKARVDLIFGSGVGDRGVLGV